MQVGPVVPSMAGPQSVSHTELRSFALNCGIVYEDGDAQTLRDMSAAYADELLFSDTTEVASPLIRYA